MSNKLFKIFNSGEEDEFNKILKNSENISRKFSKNIKSKQRDSNDNIELLMSLSSLNDNVRGELDNTKNEFNEIFKNISTPRQRIEKYNTYDDLYENLQVIKSVISVYKDSIASSDNITNKILFTKPTAIGKDSKENYEIFKEQIDLILRYFEFENMQSDVIIPLTLIYGDSFLEVIDVESKKLDYGKLLANSTTNYNNSNIITEQNENIYLKKANTLLEELTIRSEDTIPSKKILTENDYTRISDLIFEFDDNILNIEDILLEKEIKNNSLKNKNDYQLVQRIILKPHTPHNIIPIVTSYNSIVGYVYIIPKETESKDNINPLKTMMGIVNKMHVGVGSSKNKTEKFEIIIKKFSSFITKKILKSANIDINAGDSKINYDETLKKILEPKMFLTLKNLLYSTNEKEIEFGKISVKFIPPDRMIHYSINSSFNFPFGTSVIEPLVFPGKMYLLTLMTNLITKVSRSSLIRNWKIEAGSRLDHSKQVEKVKSSLRNSKLTASDFVGNSRTLSNILTDFRDVFTILQNGKEKVAVELMQQGSPEVKIQDLEDLRRELISLTGIPASMLGFPDQMGNETREYLVNTNIAFATKISNMQKMFNFRNTELLDKIFNILDPNSQNIPSDFISLYFLPPTSLTMQITSSSMQVVADIVRTLTELKTTNTNYRYFAEKFCPWIDWEDFEGRDKENTVRSAVKSASSVADQSMAAGQY